MSKDGNQELMEDVGVPTGAQPDPDHPGWWSWTVKVDDRFNRVLGKLLVREGGLMSYGGDTQECDCYRTIRCEFDRLMRPRPAYGP